MECIVFNFGGPVRDDAFAVYDFVFCHFLLTIAFFSRGGYIGDINSLKSYVAVVFWGVVVLCGLLLLLCKVEVIGHSTLEKAAKVS